MTWDGLSSWALDFFSPLILILGGILALEIASLYLKEKDSKKYRICEISGAVLGVVIVILAAMGGFNARGYASCIVVLGAFTLIIRPFRNINIAVAAGLLVMLIMYILLGTLDGKSWFGLDLSDLSSGWTRFLLAFIIGALVFSMLNFAQEAMKMLGTFLNYWPVLCFIGALCIIEGLCMWYGFGSLTDLIRGDRWEDCLVAPYLVH